ncbi:beta-xylosidase [Streptomyces sp. NPDC097619]|uniref:beta-xylosidase n=1 Tax=Streptomyces sp. NPDC097619 TaxID=3157228 RepID=UPI00332B4C7A
MTAGRPGTRTGTARGRRWTTLLGAAVLAAAAAGGTLGAPARAADPGAPRPDSGPVDFPLHCAYPQEAGLPPADGTATAVLTVDDPNPEVGDTVTVTYQVLRTPATNPLRSVLPADALTPTGTVRLGGALAGTVTVTGPRRNPAVPARGAFPAFVMTGTFTVTAPGPVTLAPGGHTLHTAHLMALDTTCAPDPAAPPPVAARVTVGAVPGAAPRAVFLGAAAGPPGARVRVTGAGFTPGAAVTVGGRTGAAPTADRTTATAAADGTLRAELAVKDPATTAVTAHEGTTWTPATGAGPAAYTVLPPAAPVAGTQQVTVDVLPGSLSMLQDGSEIALSAVPYGEGGKATGRIRTVTVEDARGGPTGWSLTARLTDFTGTGGGRIDGSRLSWTPVCTAATGSPGRCLPGTAGPVGEEGATLAGSPDAERTGGTFTVDAEVTLDVPPYTPPGAYSAVLTLTLS